ncbi:uncharacterized protein LOC110705663 [Chenopodium quinoa]|uniref:uncharacterized protein LOC110705663 n=1 Tax=Chenopodium quinoa TaxID=63459 RepID=UPI000B7854A1|nr:uncharacterized protein LOC110705663 [Chenopodium quinoa]
MDSSGVVKLNLKALNHIHILCKSSFNHSSIHFRFQPPSYSFLSRHRHNNHLLLSPSPLSFSKPASRFSPLSSLAEKVTGSGLPYGAAQATESIPSNNMLQVVLVSPQIPGNTGCIARTCAASGVKLHLVEPLGFKIDDAKVKRAGLDYWPYVVVKVHPSWAEFRNYFSLQNGEKRLLAFTKRGTAIHSDFTYRPGDWLVFGSETSGLPPDALDDCRSEAYGGATIKIPMLDTYVRCLNLSVSVGIAVYEAARQLNYEQFQCSSDACINSENPFITEDIFA